jgi:hypothetical protein
MRARGLVIGVAGVVALVVSGCTTSTTTQNELDSLQFGILEGYPWHVIPGPGQRVRATPDHANYTVSGIQPGGTLTTTMMLSRLNGPTVTLTGVEPAPDQPAIADITAHFAGAKVNADKVLSRHNHVEVALRWHVDACPTGTGRPARTFAVGFILTWTQTDQDGHVITGQSSLRMPFTVKLTGPFRCPGTANQT